MKIRSNYVSNSSSSSFICGVCNRQESGYDASPSDFGFVYCVNDHCFCEEHQLLFIPDSKWLKNYFNLFSWKEGNIINKFLKHEFTNEDEFKNYEDYKEIMDIYHECKMNNGVPEEECPICSLNVILDEDMSNYLMKKHHHKYKELADEIKNKFNSYKEFKKYLSLEE